MDYYSILGVPKNATPEQIKKAYRQKAKQHHPDKPDGNAEEFKRINEAYEILSNSDKRSAYDNPQPQTDFNFRSSHFDQPWPFSGSSFEHMFSNFGNQQRRRPKNRDIMLSASIDLKEAYTGKTLIINYTLQSQKSQTVEVTIPAGARNGDTIKYEGLGDDGHHKFDRGDLFIKIQVRDIPNWTREGDNIITKKVVNVFDLLLGCAIVIKTLDDRTVKLNIPRGTTPGKIMSINGYGLPNINNGKRGNLYIKIEAEIPKIEQENLLSQIQYIRDQIYTKE